jgi:hypothetical protein
MNEVYGYLLYMQIHFRSPTILYDLFLTIWHWYLRHCKIIHFEKKVVNILFYLMFFFIEKSLQNRGSFHALSSLVSLMALLGSQKQERTHLQPFSSTASLRISWLQRMSP